MLNKELLIKKLNESSIDYDLLEHESLYTVKDSISKRGNTEGAHTKNLFLKNKKNNFYLFSCLENTKVELKKIGKALNIGNISFASKEKMNDILGVKPGSVSPFGILNDNENKVNFFLDFQIKNFEKVSFHPLINTFTITLKVKDFINFLIENNKKVNIFCFNTSSIIE